MRSGSDAATRAPLGKYCSALVIVVLCAAAIAVSAPISALADALGPDDTSSVHGTSAQLSAAPPPPSPTSNSTLTPSTSSTRTPAPTPPPTPAPSPPPTPTSPRTPMSTPAPTSALFGVTTAAFARAVAAVCPCGVAAAAALAAQAADATPRDPARAIAVLVNVSRACPGVALPFYNRDLWRHVADAQLKLCCDIDFAKELRRGCDRVRGRACIVFVQSHAGNAAARAVAAYARRGGTHPRRFVFVSSSADDYCVPFTEYDTRGGPNGTDLGAVGRAPDAWALLESPALLAWFTENPCISHGKVNALPLGPWLPMVANDKGIPTGSFESPHVDEGKALFLQTMASVAAAGTTGRADHLLVAVNVITSSWNPPYRVHTDVRSQYIERMQNVSDSWGRAPPPAAADAAAGGGAAAAPAKHGTRGAEDYVAALAGTRYAWAPPGRGLDTHRTWECLALGCIPVVVRSPLSSAYAGLPVLQVASFANVTADLLDADWAGRRHDPGAFLAPELFALSWLARIEAAARGA